MPLKLDSFNNKQHGVSLIEVLVAIILITISLVGMAALQATGLRFGAQSNLRTQAMTQAVDIVDRMRANRAGVIASQGAGAGYTQAYPAITPPYTRDCRVVNCNALQLATFDMEGWRAGNTNVLPEDGINNSSLTFGPVDANGLYQTTVQVFWTEQTRDAAFVDPGYVNPCPGAGANPSIQCYTLVVML